MKIRIAAVGEMKNDKQLFGKTDLLIGQLIAHMSKGAKNAAIQLIVSDCYTGQEWDSWNQSHGFETASINNSEASFFSKLSRININKDTAIRSVPCEEMCNRADVVLAVWNEDTSELSGATWEFIQNAYDKRVPCIWISTKTGKVYCLWESYYSEYNVDYLSEELIPLPGAELKAYEDEEGFKKDFVLTYWEKRRGAFLQKHKASSSVHESAGDLLLDPEVPMEKGTAQGEESRKRLIGKFNEFDRSAIELNTRFQSMLYQRSILPFITTVFLAIGFYAETLVGKTLSPTFPDAAKAIINFAAVLAGVGFLIHACLNFYVYRLSKSRRIEKWQKSFINDRYTAELLRVLTHILPYGITPDLRRLCSDNKELCAQMMHICDDTEPTKVNGNHKNTKVILQHIKELLEDQCSYHEASRKRYGSILESLDKWGKAIMYTGFFMVLGRGLLQFILVLSPIESVGGYDLNSITRSFLNMLALILPAWSGYFSTKTQQNNFRYNYNNHTRMIARLNAILAKVDRLLGQGNISVEVSGKIAEELAETLINEDTAEWTNQYLNSTIKPL